MLLGVEGFMALPGDANSLILSSIFRGGGLLECTLIREIQSFPCTEEQKKHFCL